MLCFVDKKNILLCFLRLRLNTSHPHANVCSPPFVILLNYADLVTKVPFVCIA